MNFPLQKDENLTFFKKNLKILLKKFGSLKKVRTFAIPNEKKGIMRK